MTSSPLSFTPRKPIPPAYSIPSKIFIYFPDSEIYAFFCKKPEEGKPIEVRVGNEWKILERAPSIHVDSTSKYLQDYMFSPLGPQNESFDIDFYPSPKADPAKKITLMQDSFGMKDFFVREIQGEWMKLLTPQTEFYFKYGC